MMKSLKVILLTSCLLTGLTSVGLSQFLGRKPAGELSVCPNESYIYDTEPSNTFPLPPECALPVNYLWTITGGTIVNDYESYVEVVWDINTVYKSLSLRIEYFIPILPDNSFQCYDPGTTLSNTETINPELKIPASPPTTPFSLIASDVNVCPAGSPITLTTNPSTLPAQQAYVWTGPIAGSSTTPNTYQFSVPAGTSPSTLTYSTYAYYPSCPHIQSATKSTTINVLPAKPIVSLSTTNLICTTSGSVTPTVRTNASQVLVTIPGVGLWTETVTPNVATPLTKRDVPPGNYSILVQNSPGGCTETTSFSISTQQAVNSLVVTSTPTSPTCFGISNGKITSIVSNATGGVNFSLTGAQDSYTLTNTIENRPSGAYTVYARDVNGCLGNQSGTILPIAQISMPNGTITSGSLPNHNGSAISCVGANNASITITPPSGGSGNFQYRINNDLGFSATSENVFTGLAPGNYTIVVRDAADNSCTRTGNSLTISNPPPIVVATPILTHPTCSGTSTGSIRIEASGGTGALSFSVPGYGSTSVGNTVNNVLPATYLITVTDSNNCSQSVSVTVNQPITAGYTSTVASCSTVSDGSLTVTGVSGGTNSFTYSIANQANTVVIRNDQVPNTFVNLPAGIYTIRVKDSNNCQLLITNATIGLAPAITTNILQTATINCFGQSTAALNLSVSNGTPGYNYQWYKNNLAIAGPAGIAEDLSGIAAGTYKVTVTDAKTCSTTSSDFIVAEPTVVTATVASSINVSCFGGSNGSINLTPSGGTSPYTYLWSNGQTTEDITNLVAGNYSVTVTDSKGCTGVTNRIVTAPSTQISFTSTAKTDVTCFGANNGTITVAATGGTGGIQYSINGGAYQISNVFSALAPGGYVVTARDANSCTQTTASINIATPAAALSITTITKTDPLCNGASNGSFTIVAAGGTAPYQYSSNGSTYVSSNVLSGLNANAYTLRVRDANGCIVNSSSQTLSNPAVISFNTTSTTPQSCATVVDGTISVNATGGTGTKQYSINGSTFQSSGLFNSLTAGSYTVTVRDANLCTSTTSVTVGTVPAVDGIISQTAFINCFGQSTAALNVSASGGTSPYTYVWSNGSTTTSAVGLPATSHNVTITDNKGCSATKSFVVTQPSSLATTLTASSYNGFGVSCLGATNGLINQTVTGGTAPYTYAWSNGATAKDITSLSSGFYSVNVSDSRGCTTSGSVTLTAPTAVSVSLNTKTDVSCFNGNNGVVNMLGSGGTGVYTYSRDAGTNWQGSSSFSTLAANTYTILIRDQNNCQAQTTVNIAQPPLLSVAVSNIIDATCGNANGSAVALGSGGSGTIVYSWRNASNNLVSNTATLNNAASGTYTVTVQDQNACTATANASISSTSGAQFSVTSITGVTCPTALNGGAQVVIDNGQAPFTTSWGNGESGLNATGLAGGANSVTVRDGNGCEVIKTFTVPSPSPISISSLQITPPLCPGTNTAGVQVQITGGTGSYNYAWDGVAGGASLSNIQPGTYQLRVRDAFACELVEQVVVQDLSPVSIAVISQSIPACATSTDGIITVQAQGGNGSFTYSWSNNVSGAQNINIAGGSYQVTATDLKGCSATETINLSSPVALVVGVDEINAISCNGLQDGSLTALASGGTGLYQYSINNGQSWQTETDFTNLSASTYTLLGRDTNGCIASTSASITQPAALSVTITNIVSTTCNNANGSAIGNPAGGTGTYTYEWFNAANQIVSTSANFSAAPAGNYSLRVYDQNQCVATSEQVTINSSTASVINVTSVEMTSCADAADGKAMLNIVSGPGPHTVLWGNGEIGFSATQLQAGTNTVSVTDGDACVVTTTFQVPLPVPISLSTQNLINPTCPGTASGAIQVLATGGAGSYNYAWNGTAGVSSLQNIPAGTYALSITDAKGCTLNQSLTLVDLPAIEIVIDDLVSPTCAGGDDGQISVSATGANGIFTYSWANGFEGANINGISAGNYQVTATDQLGCSSLYNVVLSDPNPFIIDLGPDKVICTGQTLVVSAPVEDASYVWTDTNGAVISTGKEVTITREGNYSILVTDADGCTAQDGFRVTTSNALLTADFLAVSEAYEGDSVLLIDISWPLPEVVEWNLPTQARIVERTNDYINIIFSEAGIYALSITAKLGQCVSTYSRPITILSKEVSTAPDGRQSTDDPLIKVFTAYPNPNDGDFSVGVELGEPAEINLRLISMSQGVEVWRANHAETLNADFEVKPGNLKVGLYFLVLIVGDQTRMIRIVRN